MLSYSKGPDALLWDRTIGEQVEFVAGRWPDQVALISRHQRSRLTWAGLLKAANSVGHGLLRLGLRSGDRVGIWSVNCCEWVIVHLACARAGLVLVNVNPAYRSHELAYILRKSRMKVLFLKEQDHRANYLHLLNEARVQPEIPLQHAISFESPAWGGLLQVEATVECDADAEDVTNIQYTSGTTGSPKGVLLTHRNLLNNGLLIARALRYTEADRICVPVPLSHCFGCVIGTMSALASGAALILPSGYFDAGETMAAVEAERATAIYGVPTMFIAELNHPEFARYDLQSLRTGVMAGAPCPVETMKRAMTEMHCPELAIGYGLTETSPIVTMTDLSDSLELRVQTVGKVMPCTELQVVSLTSREVVEAGTQGEICARGYMLMKGYDQDPEATEQAIDHDGWFRTGDLGIMQDDGYFKVTGRAKDMVIRGGENIYPREIEEFLYTHPNVAEVHVTGLPDERLGESVLAWIRLRAGQTSTSLEIREFCRDQIAHFKIPQHIRFVDSFPTTLSGKIQKYRIREMELQKQSLEESSST